MTKERLTRFISMFLCIILLFSILSVPVIADQKVIWQQAVDAVYDANIPGMILMYKDELAFGGMDLYAVKMTNSKASADIAYYDGTIAARDIIDLGEVDFDKVDTIPDKGYSLEQKASPGHVYIVSTHKGEFAKIKIKSVLASSVSIKFALFQENQTDSTQPETLPDTSDEFGLDTDSSSDLMLDRFDDIQSSISIQEGNPVSFKWDAATIGSDESYEVYRSDNGAEYENLNDLRLSERQYVDEDCQVGRYYLYRVIAYNENDDVTKVYSLIKATIIKKQINITMKIGSSKVKVNGVEKQLEGTPGFVNKKVLIPVSYIKPLLNAQVAWDAKARKVTINYGNSTVVLQLNSSTALVNKKKVSLDAPLKMINGKLKVPISLFNTALNLKVKYTSTTKTIAINDEENPKEPASTTASGSEYAFKTFILWVPGAVYSTTNYNSGTNTLYVSPGTVPKSTLTVNKDGTYIWNSAYDEKVIKGSWTTGSDGSLNLIKGQEGKTWELVKSTGKTEDIFVMDGSTWYSGKAVTVKNK